MSNTYWRVIIEEHSHDFDAHLVVYRFVDYEDAHNFWAYVKSGSRVGLAKNYTPRVVGLPTLVRPKSPKLIEKGGWPAGWVKPEQAGSE